MADADHTTSTTSTVRQRLTAVDLKKDLLPLRHAEQLTRCFLYWIPVNSFPVPLEQRMWLMLFFDHLMGTLAKRFDLRPELFLQFKCIYPTLHKAFLHAAVEFSPLIGLGRRPGSKLPPPLTAEDLSAFMEGRKQFNFNEVAPDYCYWFVDKSERKQRELFFGNGGMSFIFLKPDPSTKPPAIPFSPAIRREPMFQKFDVDRIHARTFALLDGFQEKSKKLFGTGLENDPQFKGLPFILPLLRTRDFFDQGEEEVQKWFQLFDVYVNESPTDAGILLASKLDLDELLIELVKQLKQQGREYQEG